MAEKKKKPEMLPRRPGESMDAYEARFLMTLSGPELKNLLVVCAMKMKELGKQIGILKREIKARGLK